MQDQELCFDATQLVNLLLRLVTRRQKYLLQLLGFVNTHIESSSNDTDHITIFKQFLQEHHHKLALMQQEEDLLTQKIPHTMPADHHMRMLTGRIEQMLQAKQQRLRNSIFNTKGRTHRQYLHFRRKLTLLIKSHPFPLKQLAQLILRHCQASHRQPLAKIQLYLELVAQGQDISLRQVYAQQLSDHQNRSSEQKAHYHNSPSRPLDLKLDIKQLHPNNQPSKKGPITQKKEKHSKPSSTAKKRAASFRRTRSPIAQPQEVDSDVERGNRRRRAGEKIYHYYSKLVEIGKKEFLEDYIFIEAEKERKKDEIYKKLYDRNKTIVQQIKQYQTICTESKSKIQNLQNKSSGDEKSVTRKNSFPKRFVISKRKKSQPHAQESSSPNDVFSEFERTATDTNRGTSKRASQSLSRHNRQSRKRVEVQLKPKLFEEDVIPQQLGQTVHNQWMMGMSSVKKKEGGVRDKRQPYRYKCRNIPGPMEKTLLPQNFRYQ